MLLQHQYLEIVQSRIIVHHNLNHLDLQILNQDNLWNQWLDNVYSKEDFILMKNEIFARRGYSFGVRWIRNHFEKQAWYIPIDDDVYSDLNSTERKNVETLNDFIDLIEQLEEEQEAIQYRWGNGY